MEYLRDQSEDELSEHLRGLFEAARLDQKQSYADGKPSFQSWKEYTDFLGITEGGQAVLDNR